MTTSRKKSPGKKKVATTRTPALMPIGVEPVSDPRVAGLESRITELQTHLAAANENLDNVNARLREYSARNDDSATNKQVAIDALRSRLHRERLALTFAEIGTCEYDLKTSMVRSSDMGMRLLGIRGEQSNLPYDMLLERLHPEDRPKFRLALEQCLSGTGSLDIEYRVNWANGTLRWLRTKGDALLDFNGEPIKVLWITEDISQRKDMDARLRFLAHHDLLTGLPNRSLLQDRLQQSMAVAKRMQSRIALLFIDLDSFKSVNDSYGHRAGDMLLQAVAGRLLGCVRETDTVCRLAGDEYLIALTSLHEAKEAAVIAGKLLDLFKDAFTIDSHEIRISASVGISVYPDDGQSIEELMRHADAAMYHSKKGGRNRFAFFTPELNAPGSQRLTLASQLREAIESNQLLLHYQPQFDTTGNQLIGAEALVRWKHSEHGLLYPGNFISLAEESDTIQLIDEWVLNEACRQIADWNRKGLKSVPISLNFSAFQFHNGSLAQSVAASFSRHGVSARNIEIEITENAIMRDPRGAAAALDKLHEMGIRLSIDDFGTGYSSLNYLKRFPIDRLKIESGFVEHLPHDLNDAAIVQAIINLAKSLRMTVIAEGVETQGQLDFLRSLRCDAYQGFFSGRPTGAEHFETLLR